MRKIPTILTAPELLDRAFGRAAKLPPAPDPDAFHRRRKHELARVESVKDSLDAVLLGYVKAFPTLEKLPPFHRDLVRLLLKEDRVRKSLGAIDWARQRIVALANEAAGKLRVARQGSDLDKTRKALYGRISSLVEQVGKDLKFLDQARNAMRKLPEMNPELATVVIAGYPNVGKSSLLRALTDAEPEVASYPFTTKECYVGHRKVTRRDSGRRRVETLQFVDTPGLLDRPLSERNDIERQAILALRHLADVILVLLDPSEHCGYPLPEQERLLAEVRRDFPRVPLLEAETKADLVRTTTPRRKVSVETGEGVEELAATCIEEAFRERLPGQVEAFLRGETE